MKTAEQWAEEIFDEMHTKEHFRHLVSQLRAVQADAAASGDKRAYEEGRKAGWEGGAADMRERAAKACEELSGDWAGMGDGSDYVTPPSREDCVEAIRALPLEEP